MVSFLILIAFESLSQEWKIQEDYSIRFSGTGAEGTFRGLEGKIIFDPLSMSEAVIEVSLDASTIDTGNKTKNRHARGDSWLDVEKYPNISFRSSSIRSSSEGSFLLTGVFDFHGFKKEETFPFTFKKISSGAVFEGKLTIDREEYGIKGPLFGFFVGDEFEVDLMIPVKN